VAGRLGGQDGKMARCPKKEADVGFALAGLQDEPKDWVSAFGGALALVFPLSKTGFEASIEVPGAGVPGYSCTGSTCYVYTMVHGNQAQASYYELVGSFIRVQKCT
jgi:hypothetical protein